LEPHEYATMFEFETSYWWYKGLHSILVDILRGLKLTEESTILDAGCGTGQNLVNVGKMITSQAFGFDVSSNAAPFWPRKGLSRVCCASTNDIPYSSNTFDAVMSVDVLECEGVDETKALSELVRVLKPSGYLILVVPAYDWLLSEEHHRAVRASRRYTRSRVKSLLNGHQVRVLRVTHLFASLLPVVAAYRIALPLLQSRKTESPRSELRPLHPALNNFLYQLVSLENLLLRKTDLPFGSSIMAVARKVTGA